MAEDGAESKKVVWDGPQKENERAGILSLVDDFIYQILSIRRMILFGFASSIILGPPSILLSVYLFTHPSFVKALDAKDDFGEILEVLLVSTITIGTIFLVSGIREYRSIGNWHTRFKEYLRGQKEIEDRMLKHGGISGDD